MTRVPGQEIRGSLGCGEIQGAKKEGRLSSDENTGLLVCLFIWILGGFRESKVSL